MKMGRMTESRALEKWLCGFGPLFLRCYPAQVALGRSRLFQLVAQVGARLGVSST
jgi:hypothetical protein